MREAINARLRDGSADFISWCLHTEWFEYSLKYQHDVDHESAAATDVFIDISASLRTPCYPRQFVVPAIYADHAHFSF